MFLVMGNKKARNQLKADLEKSPIKLGDRNMKEVKVLKWLGDMVSTNLEESVHQTVLKRVALAKHTIYGVIPFHGTWRNTEVHGTTVSTVFCV